MRHGLRETARRWFGAGTLVVVTTLLANAPAQASVSGGGVFEGTVTITTDPCASRCLTSFSGWFRGSVGGIEVGGAAYSAVFPNPASGLPSVMTANFTTASQVTDTCPLGDAMPALTESATGSFTVSGGALVDTAGNVLEQNISLSAGWTWTGVVVGSLVVEGLETSASTLTDAQGHVLATGIIGAGSAVFAPVPPASFGTCAAPGTAVGVIAGVFGQPA